MLVFALLASAASVSLHWRFDQSASLDKAYFFQRIWMAAFGMPPCRTLLATEQGNGLMAGKHLEPILALFVPLVRLEPSMEALLAGQIVLLSLGAIAVYRAAHWTTGDRASGVLMSWAWLSMPLIWRMGLTDFRTFNLAAPFLLGCWAAAMERRIGWMLVLAMGAACCREEVAYFLLAGVPAVWWAGGGQRRGTWMAVGLATLVFLWIGVTLAVLGDFSHFVHVDTLLGKIGSDTIGLVPGFGGGSSPSISPGAAFDYLFGSIGPSLLLAPLAPFWALPLVANWIGVQYSEGLAIPVFFHYLAPAAATVPIVWAAATGRIGRGSARLARALRFVGPVEARHISRFLALGLLALNIAWCRLDPPPGVDSGVRVLQGTMRPANRQDSAWRLILQVPAGAPVVTDDMFVSCLVARAILYDSDEITDKRGRNLVIETVSWALLLEASPWVPDLLAAGFETIDTAGGAVLLHRPGPPPRAEPALCLE